MLAISVFVYISAMSQVYCNNFGNAAVFPPNLQLSGLSNKPMPDFQRNQQKTQSTDVSSDIPQYMVNLYKKLARNPNIHPFGADFIRSFTCSGQRMSGVVSVLEFPIKLPSKETIVHAMVQLCFARNEGINSKDPSFIQVLDFTNKRRMLSKKAMFGTSNCIEVPLTNAVQNAARKSTLLVLGFRIIDTNRLTNYQIAGDKTSNKQPVLIVFTRSSKRTRPAIAQNLRQAMTIKRSLKDGCKPKSLFVNFAGLGYKDIIAPTIFDAKQCFGSCTYPLGKMSNPAQHSMIQQLLFSLYGPKIAKPTCCAPRKFAPLTIMVNDTFSGGIAIRSLEDMVVAECGCI